MAPPTAAWACLLQAWASPLGLLWTSPISTRWRHRACLASAFPFQKSAKKRERCDAPGTPWLRSFSDVTIVSNSGFRKNACLISVRCFVLKTTQVWIFLGNEEVREGADGEGEPPRRCNKKARDFTHFLTHKSTLLSTGRPIFSWTSGFSLARAESSKQWNTLHQSVNLTQSTSKRDIL